MTLGCSQHCRQLDSRARCLRHAPLRRDRRNTEPRVPQSQTNRRAAIYALLEFKRGADGEEKMPQKNPRTQSQNGPSSATGTTDKPSSSVLVETLEHRRFTQFCNACRGYGYTGLCYGLPRGRQDPLSPELQPLRQDKAVGPMEFGTDRRPTPRYSFYTASVVNAPNTIQADIKLCRDTLRDLASRPLRHEGKTKIVCHSPPGQRTPGKDPARIRLVI